MRAFIPTIPPLAIGLTLIFWLIACGYPQADTSSPPVLRRGLGGEPSSLDPAHASDGFSTEVLQDLYEGLTTESATGEVIPGVAASWTADATGTEYTFQLRRDARWSNGKSVTANDFVAAWRRVVDPKEGSPVADDLRLVRGALAILAGTSPPDSLGIHAAGEYTLVVTLERPAPYFPQLLAHGSTYPIYSVASARSHDPATWISNGPYVLTSWSPGTAVRITQNAYYWDRANVHINNVEYLVVSDENAQYARYRAGGLDITDTVPPNAVDSLPQKVGSELVIFPFLATAYYGLNMTASPLASNIKLRQALAMAIDRKRLTDTLAFGQAAAFGLVPPGTLNYTPQTWAWKALKDADRIAKAQQLYAEAGYSQKLPLRLRVIYNSNPTIRSTAIVISSMWKEVLGVDCELYPQEYRVFLESRHDKTRWDVARLAWTADYNDASNFLDILREHSPNNDEGYSERSFDALLDNAAHTMDPRHRRELLEASEQKALNDYPIVPLYHFVSKRLVKPFVRGVQPNLLNHIHSKELTMREPH